MMNRWVAGFAVVWLLSACTDDVKLRDCGVARGSALYQDKETLCDGVDNDCDGLTDVLVPGPDNACTTSAQGECAVGVASCLNGARLCLTPPPVAETWDGRDNDCDGETDEKIATTVALPAMARIVAPPYLWDKDQDPHAVDGLVGLMNQAGIPFVAVASDDPLPKLDWGTTFQELDKYRLLIIPGYLIPSFIDVESGDLARLEAWIKKGGVLIWNKPLGPDPKDGPKSQQLYAKVVALGGLISHRQQMTADRLRLNGKGAATLWLDHGPERDILLSTDPDKPEQQLEVFTFKVTAETEVLAHAWRGATDLGPTWLRRKLGLGAVYTLGFDPTQYAPQRCYVNCFDPALDVAVMLFKGAWREASHGHYVVKHTVPGTEPGVLISSHDIDAPDSHNPGVWGAPGAVRMAEMEQQEGVKGTYFVTTDYVAQYYSPAMVKRLCQLGMCPDGGHSIQHLEWKAFPVGDCAVSQKNYTPSKPTICGEIAINLRMLRSAMPKDTRLDAWRTPYLEVNPHQFEVLASQGIRFDSSLATGDVRSNFPIDLTTFPLYTREDLSGLDEMWEFPVNLEDGIGWFENGVEKRRELSAMWLSEFQHRWAEQMEGNAANGAWNVMLVHPSYGVGEGVTPDNLQLKIDAAQWAIKYAKKLGLHIARIAELGDFWRGRHHTKLKNIEYKDGKYTGRIHVGKLAARRFSLEFGDRIKTFTQSTTSTVQIKGRRVVFDFILPAGGVIAFTAVVDKGAK